MIKEGETNFLNLSRLLKTDDRYGIFYNDLANILNDHKINYQLLDYTKDIWAKDYMPIQVKKDKYIQFTYDPEYLKGSNTQTTSHCQ